MKRILSLMAALTTVAILTSCGGKGNTPGKTTGSQNTEAVSDTVAQPQEPLPDSEGLAYELNETGDGYTVIGIGECTDSEIGVPATHEGLPVTAIGKNAFDRSSTLAKISLPDSVTVISDAAFYECSYLTSIRISNNVTSIGERAFDGCNRLASLNIPDSVTTIGEFAFNYCINLTSVTIPAGVTGIGVAAFGACKSLTKFTVAEGNPVYHSAGNCIIETNGKVLTAGCQTSEIPTDGSVTSIGERAFTLCTGLKSITIPDSVTEIGYRAFEYCTGLTSITIPASVTNMHAGIFFHVSFDSATLADIYYGGTEAQWAELAKEANVPNTATVHYNSKGKA